MNDQEIRKLFFEKAGYTSKSEKKLRGMGMPPIYSISGLQPNGEYVFQEFGIMEGSVIADIVTIDMFDGTISGYEIKSDDDNFRRFPKQMDAYSKVFDFNHLIIGSRLSRQVNENCECPSGWGIEIAHEAELETIRHSARNMSASVYELVRLIWRNEAYALLKRHGLGKRMSAASRGRMWAVLCERVDTCVLRSEILRTITERKGWK